MRYALLLTAGMALAGAVGLRAQTSPETTTAHAPDGSSVERIQSLTILPKTGAPFSATVVTVWTRVLEDGTRTTIKNHRVVARDSTGRIFEERRAFSPQGDTQPTRLRRLEYADPIQHEFYSCDPGARICEVSPYHAPASTPAGTQAAGNLPSAAGTVKRESLGETLIGNLNVVGSREITTINPGANGYERPEPTIKEFWYSPDLDINLVVKRFEPRGGAQDFTVENLNLSEPDPRMFSPPDGYKIVHVSRY